FNDSLGNDNRREGDISIIFIKYKGADDSNNKTNFTPPKKKPIKKFVKKPIKKPVKKPAVKRRPES
ncbi:hypothetical protein OFB79_26735, partial [Escherichia coli]|nr:hypothetical protein [Escherichia coli]